MHVNKISPRGYCHGVINAINMVKKTCLSDSPKPIFILGSIIHNKLVCEACRLNGAITLDDTNKTRLELLDLIDHGTVIFTAHGVAPDVRKKALEKNLFIVDATCHDVLKVQNNIISRIKDGFHVFYIGKKSHPETEAILSISNNITLIEKIDDIKPLNKKIYVQNQTTMSMDEIFEIHKRIKEIIPEAIIENDICNATTVRQNAVLNDSSDVIIIVGDKKSSNTNKLFNLAIKKTVAYQIETVFDINPLWFESVKSVGVSSGASTPTIITNQVIAYLEQFDFKNKKTWYNYQKINANEIL